MGAASGAWMLIESSANQSVNLFRSRSQVTSMLNGCHRVGGSLRLDKMDRREKDIEDDQTGHPGPRTSDIKDHQKGHSGHPERDISDIPRRTFRTSKQDIRSPEGSDIEKGQRRTIGIRCKSVCRRLDEFNKAPAPVSRPKKDDDQGYW